MTSIGDDAFCQCYSLTNIEIPNSVTSIGSYAFSECYGLTSITIPNSVTSIGEKAFYECRSLTGVTIGNNVTGIGSAAFDGCHKLVEVYNYSTLTVTAGSTDNGYVGYYAKNVYTSTAVPTKLWTDSDGYIFHEDSDTYYLMGYTGNETVLTLPTNCKGQNYAIYQYAFYNCDSLTSITIPNGVTSIGKYAFYNCDSLTSITIPNGTTSIGEYAFYDCTGLASIVTPDSVISIGYVAFFNTAYYNNSSNWEDGALYIGNHLIYVSTSASGAYDIREGTKCIADYAFEYFDAWFESITIPNSVTSIDISAFSGCTGLTSITIPDSVTSIGTWAFAKCTGLTSISIPNSVTSIGEYAFSYCTGLTSITIPDSVTSIGNYAFYGCSGLTSVHITDIASWCNIEFNKDAGNPLYYAHNLYLNDELVTNLVIPDSVTSIGVGAFRNCSSITSITIPDSVTRIHDYAFSGCTGLTSINFKGTKVQWKAISKGYQWNYKTGSYTIHCTDGDIAK